MSDLVRDERALWWELTTTWALGWRVVLALDECAEPVARLDGYVTFVSSTGAFCLVSTDDDEPVSVPLSLIRSVRRPHFEEDPPVAPAGARPSPPRSDGVIPGQLSLVAPRAVSAKAEKAMRRAALSMLSPDLLTVLRAVDELTRPATRDVAEYLEHGPRWASVRLRALEDGRYVRRRRGASGSWWVVSAW